MLEKGADVKWTNNKGSSLLHFLGYSSMPAAEKKALFLKLVKAGVNIDTKVRPGVQTFSMVRRVVSSTNRETTGDGGSCVFCS